jgi:hypothetical protein
MPQLIGHKLLTKSYRDITREAIETLATIMKDPDASAGARVSASSALLDRGWGRPLQSIAQNVASATLRAEDLTDDELAAIIGSHEGFPAH